MNLLLFGGAFDPIHNGHLFIAEAARAVLQADRVIFLPSGNPRHREPLWAGVHDRCTMVRIAIAGNPAFALDETDTLDDATGYTADLLPRLRARYPGAAFTFLVGGDSLAAAPWRRFDELLTQLESFVIAPRDGGGDDLASITANLTADSQRKVRLLELSRVPDSATIIRAERAAGRSARYLVPEPVWRYIETHGLYRTPADA